MFDDDEDISEAKTLVTSKPFSKIISALFTGVPVAEVTASIAIVEMEVKVEKEVFVFVTDTDSCPDDVENDIDSDNMCHTEDTCPYDAENDIDSDAICSGEQCSELSCQDAKCLGNNCEEYAVGGNKHHLCVKDGKCDTCSCSCAAKCFDTCPYDALNRIDSNGMCNQCVMHNGGCNINRMCTDTMRGVICGECADGWTNNGPTNCLGILIST